MVKFARPPADCLSHGTSHICKAFARSLEPDDRYFAPQKCDVLMSTPINREGYGEVSSSTGNAQSFI